MTTPNLPSSLKPIQCFLKAATEQDIRDPVLAYYCRMHAVQQGMALSRSPEANKFMFTIMDELEKMKLKLKDNEAVTDAMVGHIHVENCVMALFEQADAQDKASEFNTNLVKKFYTANILFGVLNGLGKLNPEMETLQKYSKWKCTYIHQCLKNGETPVPGPLNGQEYKLSQLGIADNDPTVGPRPTDAQGPPQPQAPSQPTQPLDYLTQPSNPYPPQQGQVPFNGSNGIPVLTQRYAQPTPTYNAPPAAAPSTSHQTPAYVPAQSAIKLSKEQMSRASKLSKFAASALTYEDVNEAIMQLQKALRLLTTGSED